MDTASIAHGTVGARERLGRLGPTRTVTKGRSGAQHRDGFAAVHRLFA